MTLIEQIRQHAQPEAEASKWDDVAAIIRRLSTTATPRQCGAAETIDALIAVSVDPSPLQIAMEASPNGRFLLIKLATVGVVWAHRLTQPLLRGMVSALVLPQRGMDALVQLSAPTTLLFPEITADRCRHEVVAESIRQSQWDWQLKLDGWQQRFDAAKNQIGTSEMANGVEAVQKIADEMAAAEVIGVG